MDAAMMVAFGSAWHQIQNMAMCHGSVRFYTSARLRSVGVGWWRDAQSGRMKSRRMIDHTAFMIPVMPALNDRQLAMSVKRGDRDEQDSDAHRCGDTYLFSSFHVEAHYDLPPGVIS